jgi:hypothetical protein
MSHEEVHRNGTQLLVQSAAFVGANKPTSLKRTGKLTQTIMCAVMRDDYVRCFTQHERPIL